MVNLANYLSSGGNEITILNYRPNVSPYALDEKIKRRYLFKGPEKETFISKVFQYFLPKIYSRFTVWRRRNRLKRFVKVNDTGCYLVMLESSTIDLLRMRKYVSCQIIVSERNYPENYRAEIREQLYGLAHLADGFVFQTEAAKECYGESVKNSVVIPNALNDGFADVEPFKGERRKVVINAGRLEDQKNQQLLIRAFARAKLPGYTLEIYGEGPLKQRLEDLAAELGVKDRVFLKGYSDDLKNKMYDCSLFVLSSDYEGIPNVVLEAMALGVPCITTDFAGGGAHTLIESGKDGVIVKAGDEKGLSEAMESVLNDGVTLKNFSSASAKKVKLFDPRAIYSEWEAFIKKIIETN